MDCFCNGNANIIVSAIARQLVSELSPEDAKELLVIVNLFAANLSFLIAQEIVCRPPDKASDASKEKNKKAYDERKDD